VCAIAGAIGAVRYIQLRRRCFAAYATLQRATGDDVRPAANAYWPLDRLAKRVALITLGTWVVIVLANIYAQPDLVRGVLIGVSTVAMFVVSMGASHFNMKETEDRIKAQYER
jgi:ABC-type transport system involved in cytochrome c biogenesis permease subunit